MDLPIARRTFAEDKESRPRCGGQGEVGASGVLGVTDADGEGSGGYLQAFAAFAPTVARLEPGEFLDAHSSPNFFSINAWDSVGGSAMARMIP